MLQNLSVNTKISKVTKAKEFLKKSVMQGKRSQQIGSVL